MITAKRFKILLFIAFLLFLTKGVIFRNIFVYEVIKTKDIIELVDENIIKIIDSEIDRHPEGVDDIEIVQQICNKVTSRILKISFSKAPTNPNKLFENENANCVGYSALYSSIFKFISKKYGVVEMYYPEHCVGKVKLLGYDVHKYINDPFWKNHDFVIVMNGYTAIVPRGIDPMLYDFIGIEHVNHKFTI